MSNASKFETNALVDRQGKQVSSDLKVTVLGLTPSDWDVTTLEALSEKIMVGIASAATHAYRERGVPFLRNQNILPNKLDVSDILYVSPEYEVSFQNKRLKAGDLLTARTGYPGTTCMIPDAFEGAQSFTTLITRLKTDRVLPEFVCAFMNSEQGQKFFELNQIGGGQKNVNSSILKTFPLPIPQLPEQTAIANALSDVDALIQELEKLIAKKQAIKTATMQQLLTGRTRLPQFAHHPDGRKKATNPANSAKFQRIGRYFISEITSLFMLEVMCQKILYRASDQKVSQFQYLRMLSLIKGFMGIHLRGDRKLIL